MALVVLAAAAFSLLFIVQGLLAIPIEDLVALFLAGAAVHLFATTSMGIFLATVARSMPQFALLVIITILPLQMLSGGVTPRESMPQIVQFVMEAAPTTHYVMIAQAVLFRNAGFEDVWPHRARLNRNSLVYFIADQIQQRDQRNGLGVSPHPPRLFHHFALGSSGSPSQAGRAFSFLTLNAKPNIRTPYKIA